MLAFCDRIEVIHMPDRVDRFVALSKQLARISIPIDHPKVSIPHAPVPKDAAGFHSKGVHGNFLSHLDILTRALQDNRRNVLVLEDDAIFRTLLNQISFQQRLFDQLDSIPWDFCFIGHPIAQSQLTGDGPIVAYNAPFKWAHCYLVNHRALPGIVGYLNEVLVREAGDPRGGKMYIDGALSLYRQLNPDCRCVVTKPCLSVQAGSPSGLGGRKWYDQLRFTRQMVAQARAVRDEVWRRTGCFPTT